MTNLNVKTVFTQTIKTSQAYPTTFFWINGFKKTWATGTITAIAFNFNTFLRSSFFTLTINWNNPSYFHSDLKRLKLTILPWKVFLNKIYFNDFRNDLENLLYDNIFRTLFISDYKNNKTILNNKFLLNIKESIFDIIFSNFLNRPYLKFWNDYMNIFENRTINILTSKLRRTTILKNYFFGSITILLFSSNKKLLELNCITKYRFLSILNSFSTLEAQSLSFPELIFSFEFDFKKFNLGWGHWFLKNLDEDDYFYFLKNNYFEAYYNQKNFLEVHLLTNFISSLLNNYTWFLYTEKFSSSFLEEKLNKTNLFPDFIFDEDIYNIYKYRWLFYGFTKNLPINSILLKSNNTTLNILLFFSRIFVNSQTCYNYFDLIEKTKNYKNNFLKLEFFFKNSLKKSINTFNLMSQPNLISSLTLISTKTSNFNLSNFKYHDSLSYDNSNFNFFTNSNFLELNSYIVKLIENSSFSKFKFFFFKKKKFKFRNFIDFYFNNSYVNYINFRKFKFTKKISFTWNENYKVNFLKSYNLSKYYLTFYFCKINFIQKNLRNNFFSFLTKILYSFRVLIVVFLSNKKILLILTMIFYFIFFAFKTKVSLLKLKEFFYLEDFFKTIIYKLSGFKQINLKSLLPQWDKLFYWKWSLTQLTKIQKKKLFINKKISLKNKTNFLFMKTLPFFFILFFNKILVISEFNLLNLNKFNIKNLILSFFKISNLKSLFNFVNLKKYIYNFNNNKNFFFQPTLYNLVELLFQKKNDHQSLKYITEKFLLLSNNNNIRRNLKSKNFFWFWHVNTNLNYLSNFILDYKNINFKKEKSWNLENYNKIYLFSNYKNSYTPNLNIKNLIFLNNFKKIKLTKFWLIFFKSLIKIFTNNKNKAFINDFKNFLKKPKNKNQKITLTSFTKLTKYRLKKSDEINRSTLSFFKDNKVKNLIKNFINFILRDFYMYLPKKIGRINFFYLQLFYKFSFKNKDFNIELKKNFKKLLEQNYIKFLIKDLLFFNNFKFRIIKNKNQYYNYLTVFKKKTNKNKLLKIINLNTKVRQKNHYLFFDVIVIINLVSRLYCFIKTLSYLNKNNYFYLNKIILNAVENFKKKLIIPLIFKKTKTINLISLVGSIFYKLKKHLINNFIENTPRNICFYKNIFIKNNNNICFYKNIYFNILKINFNFFFNNINNHVINKNKINFNFSPILLLPDFFRKNRALKWEKIVKNSLKLRNINLLFLLEYHNLNSKKNKNNWNFLLSFYFFIFILKILI
jgi:hypothetical protein